MMTSANWAVNFVYLVAGALDVSFSRFIPLAGMYSHVLT